MRDFLVAAACAFVAALVVVAIVVYVHSHLVLSFHAGSGS
jgi:hypothetical protein